MDINKGIRKLILESGMQQQEVGQRLGMSKANFNKYISKRDLKINSDIVRIADALNYNVQVQFISRDSGNKITIE